MSHGVAINLYIAKFEEVNELLQYLPEIIKKILAFPRYEFEIASCFSSCTMQIWNKIKDPTSHYENFYNHHLNRKFSFKNSIWFMYRMMLLLSLEVGKQ